MRLLTTIFRASRLQPQAALEPFPTPRDNPFFTGHEELLTHNCTTPYTQANPAAISQPQAISGLGGIGKNATGPGVCLSPPRRVPGRALGTSRDPLRTLTSSYPPLAPWPPCSNLPEQSEQEKCSYHSCRQVLAKTQHELVAHPG